MKKKLTAGIISAALIAGTVLPLYAQNAQTGEVTVTAAVDSVYTLSVPKAPVNIPYGQVDTNLEITVSGNVASDKIVSVTAEDGSLKSGSMELPYTVNPKELTWTAEEITEDGTEVRVTFTKESSKGSGTGKDTGSSGQKSGGTVAGKNTPKTGDPSDIYLWMTAFLVSLSAVGGIGFFRYRKKKYKNKVGKPT